jgi:hypothetical protein
MINDVTKVHGKAEKIKEELHPHSLKKISTVTRIEKNM